MNSSKPSIDYKQRYRNLKAEFKQLLLENECLQEKSRQMNEHYLKIKQDRSFLLDQLSKYERDQVDSDRTESTDSDATDTSDTELELKVTHVIPHKSKMPICQQEEVEEDAERVQESTTKEMIKQPVVEKSKSKPNVLKYDKSTQSDVPTNFNQPNIVYLQNVQGQNTEFRSSQLPVVDDQMIITTNATNSTPIQIKNELIEPSRTFRIIASNKSKQQSTKNSNNNLLPGPVTIVFTSNDASNLAQAKPVMGSGNLNSGKTLIVKKAKKSFSVSSASGGESLVQKNVVSSTKKGHKHVDSKLLVKKTIPIIAKCVSSAINSTATTNLMSISLPKTMSKTCKTTNANFPILSTTNSGQSLLDHSLSKKDANRSSLPSYRSISNSDSSNPICTVINSNSSTVPPPPSPSSTTTAFKIQMPIQPKPPTTLSLVNNFNDLISIQNYHPPPYEAEHSIQTIPNHHQPISSSSSVQPSPLSPSSGSDTPITTPSDIHSNFKFGGFLLSSDGQLTSAEIEKHFESRTMSCNKLINPERPSLTVPAELFSNESSNAIG